MSSPSTAAAAVPVVKAKKPTSPLVTAYLLAYNLLAASSWAYVLFLIVQHLVVYGRSIDTLFAVISVPLYFAQSLAVLEIFHSLFRLVSSPVVTTSMQVYSRLQLVWGIFYLVPETRVHMGFVLAATSWSLVEVPRYLFYALSLVTVPSYFAKFIRYSLFLVLYPTGISGEVWSMVSALAFVSHRGLLRYAMPNAINFSFDYTSFLYFILATYVPGSYIMYNYMLVQRKKQLSPAAASEGKKAQ